MKKLLLIGTVVLMSATSASAQRESAWDYTNYMQAWKAWHPNENFYKFSQKPQRPVKARKAKR